jgi:hypothetical protein
MIGHVLWVPFPERERKYRALPVSTNTGEKKSPEQAGAFVVLMAVQ